MRYLYTRGRGAKRRSMHLCGFDPRTGGPTMVGLCGRGGNTTINPPFRLGLPLCKVCLRRAGGSNGTS